MSKKASPQQGSRMEPQVQGDIAVQFLLKTASSYGERHPFPRGQHTVIPNKGQYEAKCPSATGLHMPVHDFGSP
ncbi:hypothetical protein Cadr_000007676 [Camelus dromedarius]|uniref:Uncharacterized protein n=1 Tax=Camelus dromedarius TaxID=9838 RepID=A0A5N4E158_CAMDR|nr:hypothetical protein Cadr_000007676 [Camelus dromedarius]